MSATMGKASLGKYLRNKNQISKQMKIGGKIEYCVIQLNSKGSVECVRSCCYLCKETLQNYIRGVTCGERGSLLGRDER